jgi:hypothetical protein
VRGGEDFFSWSLIICYFYLLCANHQSLCSTRIINHYVLGKQLLGQRSEQLNVQVRQALETSSTKKLSISSELVSAQIRASIGYKIINLALSDTCNFGMTLISIETAKLLGLTSDDRKSLPKRAVEGITGKKVNWPVVPIKLRIKNMVFKDLAAIGGSDSLLINNGIILKLMKHGFYVATA